MARSTKLTPMQTGVKLANATDLRIKDALRNEGAMDKASAKALAEQACNSVEIKKCPPSNKKPRVIRARY